MSEVNGIKAYCKYCQKEVMPRKKKLDSFEITVWVVIIISTLGFALIPFLIYNKFRKRIFCPNCFAKVELETKKQKQLEVGVEGAQEEEEKTQREQVMEKVEEIEHGRTSARSPASTTSIEEEIEEEDEDKRYCPFCGAEVSTDMATCPYCSTVLRY